MFILIFSYCMTMHFGYKDFQWMDEISLGKLKEYLITTNGIDIKTNSDYGFLIECDLEVDENFIGKSTIFLDALTYFYK